MQLSFSAASVQRSHPAMRQIQVTSDRDVTSAVLRPPLNNTGAPPGWRCHSSMPLSPDLPPAPSPTCSTELLGAQTGWPGPTSCAPTCWNAASRRSSSMATIARQAISQPYPTRRRRSERLRASQILRACLSFDKSKFDWLTRCALLK